MLEPAKPAGPKGRGWEAYWVELAEDRARLARLARAQRHARVQLRQRLSAPTLGGGPPTLGGELRL